MVFLVVGNTSPQVGCIHGNHCHRNFFIQCDNMRNRGQPTPEMARMLETFRENFANRSMWCSSLLVIPD
ncbi:MAG: hypothetical protein FWG65_03715 [Turicibacter sp.]|nr:hypothetical protein [Turicibacter sp.]